MRVVIQRVSEAFVEAEDSRVASIGPGLLVLAAFKIGDGDDELAWMVHKCLELRIFEDDEGKMNLSVREVGGEVLVVSQFTLYANCRKGRRPAYAESAPAPEAEALYTRFVEMMRSEHNRVAEGVFGAKMRVGLVNDGPVTVIIDRSAERA
jgi:D-tyrosyl-tRNA(Tyr) deacylase